MARSFSFPSFVLLGFALAVCGGCASPADGGPEATREVVLQYLGGNVGTVGPLSKTAKKEFSVLAASEQARAGALIDLGGEAFLVYKDAALSRIVIVAGRKVVGDFTVPPKL
jgi:hypothetical protein